MRLILAALRLPELRRYLLGLALVFVGAWATGESGSMVPLALAASAWMMLTVPLLRRLLRTARSTSRRR